MARSKKTAKAQKNGPRKSKPAIPRYFIRPKWNNANAQYMELLRNPCTGPLVHGPGSTEGGQVVRFEKDFILGAGALETAGFFNWAPGAMNFAPTSTATNVYSNGLGFVSGTSNLDTTGVTPVSNQANAIAYIPGFSFMTTNASSYRCLAACVQIYFPGTELNRQGIVAGAHSTFGLINFNGAVPFNVVAPADVRAVCPITERTPTDHVEFKWAPNFSDGIFRNPGGTNTPDDGHAALLITWAGLPVNTGLRFRLVAVYEWKAKTTQGLVLSSNTSTTGAGDIQETRKRLDSENPNWWYSTGQAAAHFMSGATAAYASRRGPSHARTQRVEF